MCEELGYMSLFSCSCADERVNLNVIVVEMQTWLKQMNELNNGVHGTNLLSNVADRDESLAGQHTTEELIDGVADDAKVSESILSHRALQSSLCRWYPFKTLRNCKVLCHPLSRIFGPSHWRLAVSWGGGRGGRGLNSEVRRNAKVGDFSSKQK